MSNQPTTGSSPATPPESWGEVRTRDQVVRYRRSGAGRAVLVLHGQTDSDPIWPEVLELLAARGRLIIPNPPEQSSGVDQWLVLLLDGLGLSNVLLVASEGFGMAAIERALLEPDRIDRIIIASARASDTAVVAETRSRLGAVPLLVLKLDQPVGEVIPVVAAFVAGT